MKNYKPESFFLSYCEHFLTVINGLNAIFSNIEQHIDREIKTIARDINRWRCCSLSIKLFFKKLLLGGITFHRFQYKLRNIHGHRMEPFKTLQLSIFDKHVRPLHYLKYILMFFIMRPFVVNLLLDITGFWHPTNGQTPVMSQNPGSSMACSPGWVVQFSTGPTLPSARHRCD